MTFKILKELGPAEPPELADEHFNITRDGAKLATDIYAPFDTDPRRTFPTVLCRTPYDKRSRLTALQHEAEYFKSRGYVFVAQDVRGKFRSTGATEPYTYDVDDGYDTVEWIVQQPWSDGRVGTAGASYAGFTTWPTVASGHPAVKAAAPAATGVDVAARHVASQWQHEPANMLGLQDLLQNWTSKKGYEAEIDYSASPNAIIGASEEAIGPCIGARKLLERAKHQGRYNPYGDRRPYWTTRIPILHCQSWYDPSLGPLGMDDWRHFQTLPSRNVHYLRARSTDHSSYKLEDVGLGQEKNPHSSLHALQAKIAEETGAVTDFFDEHIKGLKPSEPRPRAKWHVGYLGWCESACFPPPSTPYILKLARSSVGTRHSLQSAAGAEPSVLRWRHDPNDPVPSTTDIEGIYNLLAAYPDEQVLEKRDDVLTKTGISRLRTNDRWERRRRAGVASDCNIIPSQHPHNTTEICTMQSRDSGQQKYHVIHS